MEGAKGEKAGKGIEGEAGLRCDAKKAAAASTGEGNMKRQPIRNHGRGGVVGYGHGSKNAAATSCSGSNDL